MKGVSSSKPKQNSATLQELAEHMFTKKLGLSIPEHSPNSFRVMAARAKCMPKINRNTVDQHRSSRHDVKETTKKIRDLTTIESQYSKYLIKFKSHDQLKDQKHVSQSFWTFIQHQPISMKTKEKLALKLNSPFRINLSEFGNKSLNVNKYISLLDSSDAQEPQQTGQTAGTEEQPNVVGKVAEGPGTLQRGQIASQPDSIRLFPRATSRSGPKLERRPRNRNLMGATARNADSEYHSGSPGSYGTAGKNFFKAQQISSTAESSAPRIYPTPSRPSPKTFSGVAGSAYLTSRTTNTHSAKLDSARLRGLSRQSPDTASRVELRETVERPGTRESTWRPSFLQINPQKVLLKDKIGQVMDQCDQMQQTGSSWMRNSTGYRGIEEKSLSRSTTPAYFKPAPYMVVKQKRRAEPSTQAEFSSFTPERSSPTETRRGLEQAIKLRIAQRTAQQDAELAIRQVESQVEMEIERAQQQLQEKDSKPMKFQRPLLKRSGTKQGFSPRNNSPDTDVTLQANMLHNLISFGNPNATKKEVVERMIEFKDVGGRKLVKADMQMLAETRNFFITNAKAK